MVQSKESYIDFTSNKDRQSDAARASERRTDVFQILLAQSQFSGDSALQLELAGAMRVSGSLVTEPRAQCSGESSRLSQQDLFF